MIDRWKLQVKIRKVGLANVLMLVASLACVCVAGCGGPPRASQGGFDSDNPGAKLYAIHDAGANRDATKLRHLVAELDSDDPTVRMMSIEALERITQTRLGYNPYDNAAKRQDAIRRWVDAVKSGQFVEASSP